MAAPIVVYTGTQVWESRPEIRPTRKGRAAHGPGLYFTTSLATARKYAKGRGVVLRVEIDPNFTWLEDAVAEKGALIYWVKKQPGLRHKDEIVADLIERAGRGLDDERLARVYVLVNLMINYDVIKGKHGPALAEFLAKLGIGASRLHQSNEDWVVLFDPNKVIRWEKVGADAPWSLPSVREKP